MERATQTMEAAPNNRESAELSQTGAQPAAQPAAQPVAPQPAEQLAQTQTLPPSPKTPPKKRVKFFLLVVGLIALGGIAGGAWWVYAQGHEETDDSYVDGHITTISSRVAGTVTQVFVDDNQRVTVNQPLVKLDPRDFQVKVKQLQSSLKQAEQQTDATQVKIGQSTLSGQGQTITASAEIKSAEAKLDRSKSALLAAKEEEKQAESKVAEERAQLEFARTDFERYRLVYEQRAVTGQQYDQAKQNIKVAEAQLQGALQSLQQSKQKVFEADANIRDAEANQLKSQGQVTSAQATERQADIDKRTYQSQLATNSMSQSQLDEALLQLSYTDINAPVAGRVGRKSVEVGQRLQVGQALMAVVQDDSWVTANFKETQLNKMRVGQEAEVRIDSFPGKVFKGKVDSLSPASGSKFSVLPPDNATGNFTKVVQRVPVKIVLDPQSVGDYAKRITPGLSCVSTVNFH